MSTYSLDPYLWEESDHPAFGPPASISLSLASSSITPAGSVHTSRGDSVVRMWVQLKRWCVWVLQRGHSGDGCDLASTLCKYDLRKGDLFVLSWAMVRRVRRGSLSSEMLMCGGGVRSILLLHLVGRCLETIDVCIWRMFDCVGVCANVCCVAAVVKIVGFLSLGVLKYLCVCDGCCVFCLYCEAWSCSLCSCLGSVSVSSCRCCMFVSCVHPVTVLNAAFCMTYSLLMLVEYGRGILQSWSHNCLVCSHECLLLFTPSCCSECVYDL